MTVADTLKGALEAMERRNSFLNAFVQVSPAEALAQAARLDAKGGERGLLHGTPIAVKDIIHVAGEVSGCGSLTRKGAAPETRDAVVVAKLRDAGAIIPGKVNTVEYAFGGYGTNITVGTPRNPWDVKVHRVPGGSSSGSGVAVGGGLVPGALGTDTGGSVRIPAALCGCVGLKTSIGLVSRTGVAPLSVRLDTVGPLAQDVRTAALMLAAIMGRDEDDPSTHHDRHMRPQDVLDRLEDGVVGMRIGRLDPTDLQLATHEVKADYEAALKRLQEAGATLAVCRLPKRFDAYQSLVGQIVAVEGYGYYKHFVDDPASGLAAPIRDRMLGGK
ncbi:MAG: amidase, partial [Hyphomicrobiaceae bacterium]